LIDIEIYLGRIAMDESQLEESRIHYEKAITLCNEAIAAGDSSVWHKKVIALQEMDGHSGQKSDAGKDIQTFLKIAREEYLSKPGNLSALLTYVGACDTAGREQGDKSLLLEAIAILQQTAGNIPDRPKVIEKMIAITTSLAELYKQEGNLASALESYESIIPQLKILFQQNSQWGKYLEVLLSVCKLCQELKKTKQEGDYRKDV
jgi:tetratricopeptide (TPR) repeat protein